MVHVALEAVTWPHSDSVVVLFYFLAGGILGEECLSHLFEVAEKAWRKRVEPIKGYTLQTGQEDRHMRQSLREWNAITS